MTSPVRYHVWKKCGSVLTHSYSSNRTFSVPNIRVHATVQSGYAAINSQRWVRPPKPVWYPSEVFQPLFHNLHPLFRGGRYFITFLRGAGLAIFFWVGFHPKVGLIAPVWVLSQDDRGYRFGLGGGVYHFSGGGVIGGAGWSLFSSLSCQLPACPLLCNQTQFSQVCTISSLRHPVCVCLTIIFYLFIGFEQL